MKKILITIFIFLLIANISAQEYKLQIQLNKNTFKSGEDIIFRVNIYDQENKIIYDYVDLIIEDIEKTNRIEEKIYSKEPVIINLKDKEKQGQWRITAIYKNIQTKENFFIEAEEKIYFSLEENILYIKNIGNIKLNKEIQIVIGDVIGEKQVLNLDVNEEKKYRLVAPEGSYNIKVISEGEILFEKSNVLLKESGLTGKAIGAIDEKTSNINPITGGITPKSDSENAFLNYLKQSKISYIFIMAIFGATILIIIERRYTKKTIKNKIHN